MIEAKEYLKNHPEATLNEYVKYVDKIKKDEIETAIEIERNKKQWYEDLIGRYFCINFNDRSKAYCKLSKNDNGLVSEPCYNIYKDSSEISFKKETRYINYVWFNNPYEDNYKKDKHVRIVELTKEQYDEVVSKIEPIISNISNLHGMY